MDEEGEKNKENGLLAGLLSLDGLEEEGINAMKNLDEMISKVNQLSFKEDDVMNESISHLMIF